MKYVVEFPFDMKISYFLKPKLAMSSIKPLFFEEAFLQVEHSNIPYIHRNLDLCQNKAIVIYFAINCILLTISIH